jgi:acetyl esterase/lipase
MRPAPLVLTDLFRGLDAGDARVTRDVPFAAPHGIRLTLDVYQPSAAGPHPCVVQIYGGAWQRGEPGDNAKFATYLAAHGSVVFAIDYRHAPEFPWPAQIEDVRAALAWIRGHAGDYDADASRLALLGRSAGAHLAMIAAYEAAAAPVRAVVSYYGPVDLNDGYRNPPSPDPLDVRAIEEALLGGTPDQMPDRYREASPISYVTRRLPPSLLIYGGRDHVVLPMFGARLDERLRAQGATSVYLEIPWAEHAFDAVPNGPSGQLSLYYTEQFLAWALRHL